MNFEELIKEIEKNREIASLEIGENADPRTVTTKIGHIKRAKINLKDLFLEYRKHVMEQAVFIVTKGKQYQSFVDTATSEYGCFAVDANEVFETVAKDVNKANYLNKTSNASLFDILMSVFNDVCDQIGIVGYPMVTFSTKYKRNIKSKEEFVSLIKEAFNEKIGSELITLYAVDKVARKAMDEGYSGTTIPVILYSEDTKDTEEIAQGAMKINPNVFEVSTTKKHDKESVEKELVKIRESLKKES